MFLHFHKGRDHNRWCWPHNKLLHNLAHINSWTSWVHPTIIGLRLTWIHVHGLSFLMIMVIIVPDMCHACMNRDCNHRYCYCICLHPTQQHRSKKSWPLHPISQLQHHMHNNNNIAAHPLTMHVAPFRQGSGSQSSIFSSQLAPDHPFAQTQV